MPLPRTYRVNGTALRDLRVSGGLSLNALALRIGGGRHPQSIRRMETDAAGKRVSAVFAHQIANALEVDVSEFATPVKDDESDGAAA